MTSIELGPNAEKNIELDPGFFNLYVKLGHGLEI